VKLMVVDDSLAIRRKIERCACMHDGITIISAPDGKSAIELFRQEMPELVTMDLTMPHIDGVECIKVLIDINPETHILVVSALSDKLTALTAIKNGAEGFLKKPFSDEDLNIALSELLTKEAPNGY
jgi:two-component system, chemotaxis family, chemotaxis protein CheY